MNTTGSSRIDQTSVQHRKINTKTMLTQHRLRDLASQGRRRQRTYDRGQARRIKYNVPLLGEEQRLDDEQMDFEAWCESERLADLYYMDCLYDEHDDVNWNYMWSRPFVWPRHRGPLRPQPRPMWEIQRDRLEKRLTDIGRQNEARRRRRLAWNEWKCSPPCGCSTF
jgi:hypothetical protein